MTRSALETALLDELFVSGRAWNEDATDVAEDVLDAYPDADQTGYSTFVTRVDREFGAVSDDMLRAAGADGIATDYTQEAVNGLFSGHYADQSITDWKLWTDRSLRARLTNRLGLSYAQGRLASETSDDLLDVVSDYSEEPTMLTSSAETILPSADLYEDLTASRSVSSDIGSFGPVGFTVSSKEIYTLSELSRRREAGYAEHKVINSKARLQFTGIGLWEVTLRVRLSRNWTDPEARIAALTAIQAAGEYHPLAVGGRNLGNFVLVSYSEAVKAFGRGGEIERAELDLSLREYPEGGTGIVSVSRNRSSTAASVRRVSKPQKLTTNLRGR